MNFRTLKIRTKLALMVLSFFVVLVTYAALSYNTRQQLQIDGPYFDQISRTRQLLTDISPAPLNIAEPFLVVQQLADSPDANRRSALVNKLRELRQNYESTYAVAQKALSNEPNERFKHIYLVNAYEPAMRFFAVTERELVPAVLAGDQKKVAALIAGSLHQASARDRTSSPPCST